jgi:hypothetical protein
LGKNAVKLDHPLLFLFMTPFLLLWSKPYVLRDGEEPPPNETPSGGWNSGWNPSYLITLFLVNQLFRSNGRVITLTLG